jgi:hypothetical protein
VACYITVRCEYVIAQGSVSRRTSASLGGAAIPIAFVLESFLARLVLHTCFRLSVAAHMCSHSEHQRRIKSYTDLVNHASYVV